MLVKEAHPYLQKSKYVSYYMTIISKLSASSLFSNGSVVFVSSVAGYLPLKVSPELFSVLHWTCEIKWYIIKMVPGPYCVTKTSLFGLTKVLAQELATDSIRVNCIAPGLIKTKLSKLVSEEPFIANLYL